MTVYSWVGPSTGSWDDSNNWENSSLETPAGPPGAGDTAALGAVAIAMDDATVGDIFGSADEVISPGAPTTLTGNFTVTGTLAEVNVDGGDEVSIGGAESCTFASGKVQVADLSNVSNTLDGAASHH